MGIVQSSNLMPGIPSHVAIIMDGNGRWATGKSLTRLKGHEQGAKAVREAVKGCRELGIPFLTLFAFSSENWKRPKEEVNHLMGLFRYFIQKELTELKEAGVKVKFIGNINRLPKDIQKLVDHAKAETAGNKDMVLTVALSYGGQQEIVHAAKALAEKVKAGTLAPEEIDEALFADHLDTADIPDPDLVIRTSGEKRLSNFLLWQCAYSELVFLDVLWPDFKRLHLEQAIEEYLKRCRRYGAVSV
ncbi:isoprenyl transferase [Sneathiella chinensis]|uniref:Isoprenyl transferase n=1 Tax=Sneathiella chinensis TaxID=349750 RepID=A0ABQ5U4W2_9PROT|nr:isoprenyl transferase [Sneathiella chinensis]GLQ07200.1 isoprenyl transferase [Sneathiella chinensis]